MSNESFLGRAQASFTPNYRPAPLVLEEGEGCYVEDVEGNRYLDMISGIAVSALGHGHPALVAALKDRVSKVLHTSNLYLNRPSIELAEKIVAAGFGERVYFCNSGAEANESCIKLARKFAYDRGDTDRVEIISFDGSFHGRTFAALTATAQPKYHKGFHPLPAGFTYLPFADESALDEITRRTAAVIVEPIQGEGGVRVPPVGYLEAIRRRCDETGALLIFDEVQVGVGRTGTVFAHQHEGVTPDLMALAKGLGAGLPLGAMVATAEVAESLTPGSHATTYGGNPVACTAGSVVMDALKSSGFLQNVRDQGERLMVELRRIGEGVFSEVRGRGLLIGAELEATVKDDAKVLVAGCRARGVLVHIAGPRVLRLAPPLIVGDAEVQEAIAAIEGAISDLSDS